jgi:hypothetical protein
MSQKILIYSILIMLSAMPAHAGYADMKNVLETYSPPPYIESHMRPPSESPAPESPAKDKDFEAQKKQIQENKAAWEKLLSDPEKDIPFIRTDSKEMEKFRAAASDDAKTAGMLRKNFSLEDVEMLALFRNPGIKAEESRLRAAIEGFDQVSALDEILRQYTAYTESLMPGVGPMKGKEPLKVKFPFPGVLSLKGEVVNQEAAAARETLQAARRDAVALARKTYWNLLFVRKARKITGETLELLRRLQQVVTTRYEAGNTSFQDVAKLDIQTEMLGEELRTLRETQKNLESKLLEILNLSPDVRVGAPKDRRPPRTVPPLDSLYTMARQNRQELRRMNAMIGKMERMVEMAETMILPPYTLNLSAYDDDAVMKVGTGAMKESFPVSTEASRGSGLPQMPWYGTNDAYLRQTRQKLLGLRQDLKKAESATDNMVRNAWFELDRAKREEALYRNKIVDLSRSALDVSTWDYEAGRLSFADVISSYMSWLNIHLSLERKRSDIGVARAELERIIGVSL